MPVETSRSHRPHPPLYLICLILILAAVILRLPFFFVSAGDSYHFNSPNNVDEGYFMYEGKDVLEGYLPYEKHWDSKPPLGWYIYAALDALDGYTLYGMRLIGAIYIGLTACVLYCIMRRKNQEAVGLWAAGFFIVFVSTIPCGQSFVYDHIVGLPFAVLLYQLLKPPAGIVRIIAIGMLYTICCLILTNYLFFFPALAWIFLQDEQALTQWRKAKTLPERCEALRKPAQWMAIITGFVLLAYFIIWGIYAARGMGMLFIDSMFRAPLMVAKHVNPANMFSFIEQFFNTIGMFAFGYGFSQHYLIVLLTYGFVLGTITMSSKKYNKYNADDVTLLVLLFFSFVVMAARGPSLWPYLAQIMPVCCLAMGRAASVLFNMKRLPANIKFISPYGYRTMRNGIFLIGLLLSSSPIWAEYGALFNDIVGKEPQGAFFNDKFYTMAKIVNAVPTQDRSVFMCKREEMLYPLAHLESVNYILFFVIYERESIYQVLRTPYKTYKELVEEKHPQFIFNSIASNCNCYTDFLQVLHSEYRRLAVIDNTEIYQRKSDVHR